MFSRQASWKRHRRTTFARRIDLTATARRTGLRDIPRWIPVHRLIWRNWEPVQAQAGGSPGQAAVTHPDNTATSG